MKDLTAYELRQIREALSRKPAVPVFVAGQQVRDPKVLELRSAQERGCGLMEAEYERYLVESAMAQAREKRA